MKNNPTRYLPFSRKNTPTPTLTERYGSAMATHSAALSVFDDVLDDLLSSEAELHDVAAEAQREIDDRQTAHEAALDQLQTKHYNAVLGLAGLRDVATDDAEFVAKRADKIRELVG